MAAPLDLSEAARCAASIKAAEAVLDRVVTLQQGLQTSRVELANERAAVAYSALADGDKDARTKLDAINLRSVLLDTEIEAAGYAIAEARRRIIQAQSDARREQRNRNRGVMAGVMSPMPGPSTQAYLRPITPPEAA
jgi:hypothetical protein